MGAKDERVHRHRLFLLLHVGVKYSNIGLAQIKTYPLLSLYFLPAFVLSCSFPKEPAGGEVTVTHLHPGGEAFFHCFTGYRLQGPKMLTCRNATTPYWSGKEPRCVGKTQQVFLCAPQVINAERWPLLRRMARETFLRIPHFSTMSRVKELCYIKRGFLPEHKRY